MEQVPFIVFESAQTRLERANRRMFILCAILAVMLLVTNGCWIYYEQQFEDVVVTQDVKSNGDSNVQLQNVGGDYYGGGSEANN